MEIDNFKNGFHLCEIMNYSYNSRTRCLGTTLPSCPKSQLSDSCW